jgi:integrase
MTLVDMPTFEMPSEQRDGQEAPWLRREQVDFLIDVAEWPLRGFVTLAYWWAARRASIEQLTVQQVNLTDGRVALNRPGQRMTKKRRPIVPVYDEVRPTLERLVSEASGGWLFGPTVDFYRPFVKLCKDAGLGEIHPHVLRHSRATHMLMAGESIYKVARLLGDTVKTVESVYGHASPEYLAESAART